MHAQPYTKTLAQAPPLQASSRLHTSTHSLSLSPAAAHTETHTYPSKAPTHLCVQTHIQTPICIPASPPSQARTGTFRRTYRNAHAATRARHSRSHTCTLVHICSMIRTREQLTCARRCLGVRRHGLTDTHSNVSVHIHMHTQAYTQSQRQTHICTLTHT